MGFVESPDRGFHKQFERSWNDVLFRKKPLEPIDPETQVLELNAGAGIFETMHFYGIPQQICGIGLDPKATNNPLLDESLAKAAGKGAEPNITHYRPLIGQITPHGFHHWINRKREGDETEAFLAHNKYDAPSDIWAITNMGYRSIDGVDSIQGRPESPRVSALIYLSGLTFGRLVNATDLLLRFRILVIAQPAVA